MQRQYVSGASARPKAHGPHLSSTRAAATLPGREELLTELRGEVSNQWQLVRALRQQRHELDARELAALQGARAGERRVRQLERDVEAQGPLAGGGS